MAILGGGPAGAAAAIVLARSGVRTLLVDRTHDASFKVGEALPPAARPLLEELGCWAQLASNGHLRSHGTDSAWGSSEIASTQFISDPNGHGWHLDRLRFDAELLDVARSAGAQLKTSTTVTSIARAATGWTVALDDDGGCSAAWLLDCTGRRAWAARRNGATRIADDHLVAFVSVYTVDGADVDSMTLVESAPDGWWYTARLPGGRRVVVYLTDAHDTTARKAGSPPGFSELLGATRHIRARLEAAGVGPWCQTPVSDTGPPRIVAADTSRLDRVAGDGWLAAGDAAASFDPLSSQGIFTALYSGRAAARALMAHMDGDRTAVPAYCARIDSIYSTYLARRREYYQQERRWVRRNFWRQRT